MREVRDAEVAQLLIREHPSRHVRLIGYEADVPEHVSKRWLNTIDREAVALLSFRAKQHHASGDSTPAPTLFIDTGKVNRCYSARNALFLTACTRRPKVRREPPRHICPLVFIVSAP